MLPRQQRWVSGVVIVGIALTILCGAPRSVAAQEQERSSFIGNVVKGVALDPTTYAPALFGYDSTRRDWDTSQPFFQHGFFEHNQRFTISGLPNDVPVSYSEGNRRILMDALGNLQVSLVNNFMNRVVEQSLLDRYPEHRKLVKTLGWIERTAFASYMSYTLSEAHYRQWRANEALARQMGY